jgi:hypothetical protein
VGITPMMTPSWFFVRKPTDTHPAFEPLFHTRGIKHMVYFGKKLVEGQKEYHNMCLLNSSVSRRLFHFKSNHGLCEQGPACALTF